MTASLIQSTALPKQNQQLTIDPGIRDIDPKDPKLHMIQSRASMDFHTVSEYAEMMLDGVSFEPGKAFEDEQGNIWGYDGKHRCEACIDASNNRERNPSGKRYLLRLEIRPGTQEQAEWEALGANKFHGLPRSDDDKERVVELAFTQHRKSEREIARHTGLSRRKVSDIKKRLIAAGRIDEHYKPIVKRGAQEYEQNNTQRVDKLQGSKDPQHASGTVDQIDAAEQIELPGAENYWTLKELVSMLRSQIPGNQKERLNYLQNIIQRTVAGQAYLRELYSFLSGLKNGNGGKQLRAKSDLIQALKQLRDETSQIQCAGREADGRRCLFIGTAEQMFSKGEGLDKKWYCGRHYEPLNLSRQEEGDPEVLQNVILRKIPADPEERLLALRRVMFEMDDTLQDLVRKIPGFPPKVIRDQCFNLWKRLSAGNTAEAVPQKSALAFPLSCDLCGKREPDMTLKGKPAMTGDSRLFCETCWEKEQSADEDRKDVDRELSGKDLEKVCEALRNESRLTPNLLRRLIDDSHLTYGEREIAHALMDYVDRHGMTVTPVSAMAAELPAVSTTTESVRRVKDCSSCEYWRSRNNRKHGVTIPEGVGKCIREGGHCDPDVVKQGIGQAHLNRRVQEARKERREV